MPQVSFCTKAVMTIYYMYSGGNPSVFPDCSMFMFVSVSDRYLLIQQTSVLFVSVSDRYLLIQQTSVLIVQQ